MQNSNDILDGGTGVGAVTLKVADLDGMTDYYSNAIGLAVLGQEGDRVTLGRGATASVILEHTPLLKHAAAGSAGLFHTAILFEQEADLAASVYSVVRNAPRSFTGSSDHLVSKALYFDDPEGNGVELYWDRPSDQWEWNKENGISQVKMGTLYLDPNEFLQQNLSESGLVSAGDGAAAVGHVHLKVGDVASARAFYVDTVGFEVTAEFGSQALFVSAGKYHHHLGMNTWQSRGALDRSPALGLGEVSIELPTLEERGALAERLRAKGVAVRDDGTTLSFDDPWKNLIRVDVKGAGAGEAGASSSAQTMAG